MLTGLGKILTRIQRGLPVNGLTIYTDGEDYSEYTPKTPLTRSLYRCGAEYVFYAEPTAPPVAVIAVDNTEACIATVSDGNIQVLDKATSGVGGKHDQGGQSQRRYERNRMRELNDYYKRVASKTDCLLKLKPRELAMCGPWLAKHRTYEKIDYRLKQIPCKFIDMEYAGVEGVYQYRNRVNSSV